MNEQEARVVLQERMIERDIAERRTCAQIVEDMGLVPVADTVTIVPVIGENGRLQAENMTRNVEQVPQPYFVKTR